MTMPRKLLKLGATLLCLSQHSLLVVRVDFYSRSCIGSHCAEQILFVFRFKVPTSSVQKKSSCEWWRVSHGQKRRDF